MGMDTSSTVAPSRRSASRADSTTARTPGIGRLAEHLRRDGDPQPPEGAFLERVRGDGRTWTGGRVEGIVAGDRLGEEGDVLHGPAEGADLVEAGTEGDEAVARAAPVGGLEPDESAEAGGEADRAAGVGAEGQGGRDRPRRGGGGAARGAAGGAGRVPGVRGPTVGAGLRRGAHGELVEVRLAQDGHPERPQPARRRSRRRAGRSPGGSARRRWSPVRRSRDCPSPRRGRP